MKIGIWGFGNIAKAYLKGSLKEQCVSNNAVFIYTKTQTTKLEAQNYYNVNVCSTVIELINKCDVLIIAIKPSVFHEIAPLIDSRLFQNKIIVSFMAGVSINTVQNTLHISNSIIRVLPNIAMENGTGVMAIACDNFHSDDYQTVKPLFEKLGYVLEGDEKNLDNVMAASGCGLAFASFILENYIKSTMELGFDYATSQDIVAKTFSSAILLGEYNKTILRVATKGGVTEKGMHILENNNLKSIFDATFQSVLGEAGAL